MAFDPWFFITQAGAPELWIVVGILLGLAGILRGRKGRNLRRFSVSLVAGLLVTLLIVGLVKEATRVPRPCSLLNPYCDPGFAFPSGHAAAIFVFFTSVALTDNSINRKSVLRSLPFGILASFVAFSRVALGAHSVPDVIAGAVLGIGISGIVWVIFWEILWKKGGKAVKKTRGRARKEKE